MPIVSRNTVISFTDLRRVVVADSDDDDILRDHASISESPQFSNTILTYEFE